MSPTRKAVVVARTAGSGKTFVIKSIKSIEFQARSGGDLTELLQRLVVMFNRGGKGRRSTIALLGSSSGRFKSSVEAIKAEAMTELAAAESGLPIVRVTAASLKKVLGCAMGQKWQARAEERFNPRGRHENWSRGAAGAVAAALKVAGTWVALVAALPIASCGGGGGAGAPQPPSGPSRTYVMGFSAIPPRLDPSLVGRTIDLWAQRADAALVLQDPPWAELLAGQDPEALVRANPLQIATYLRGKGLRLIGSIDPTNGLDRSAESAALSAARRSLGEPAVRQLYRRYVGAFVRLVRPEALTVASETNLIRAIAPASVYAAVVAAGNEAAAEARAQDPALQLMITVQVEVANGRLPGGVGAGLARDRADFPFAQALGLSSFPFLAGVGDPEELPLDYYSRLTAEAPVPLLVIEGGWPSVNVAGVLSSSDEQRRYIERQALMLDAAGAEGWFQITFTDLDPTAFPAGIGPFANLGLVDVNLRLKPALQAWDDTFRRPLRRP